MITVRQKKCFEKRENKKVCNLKGGFVVVLQKPYSLRKRGKFIDLFRGRERISFFCEEVAPETIENYVSGYEYQRQRKEKMLFLKAYCEAPASYCEKVDWNCDKCSSSHKEWALQRKKEGKKVVRPGKKTGGLMEAIEERNALLKQTALKNKENKETFFKRNYSGKWR